MESQSSRPTARYIRETWVLSALFLGLAIFGVHCGILAGLEGGYEIAPTDAGEQDVTIDNETPDTSVSDQFVPDTAPPRPNPRPFFASRLDVIPGDASVDAIAQIVVAYPLDDAGTRE